MKDIKIKKKYIIIMVITLIVGVGAVTLAYFQGNVINDLINGTTVSTGNIDIKISDTEVNVSNVNPVYNGSANYEDATFKKTFTVTNSGTLNTCTDLYLKINSIADSLKSTDFRYIVINDETGTTLEGNFSEASNGNDLKLGSLYFFEGETSKKYTMYIWIEYQESKDQISMLNKTMNATLFVKGKDVKTKDACDNRSNYKITYETYGKTNCTSDTVSKGGTVTLCTPTSDGEEFKGWYTDSSYTNQVTSLTNITEDTKLYAKWNCIFNGTLTQGTEFVKGQYTYRYMQAGKYSSELAWENITKDGWGVQLTDRTNTDHVTSKVCTYINNKPVVSMSYMFGWSKTKVIDLASFNTSNVTNMAGMFKSSQVTTLDLSSFDTNKVTDMSAMFADSQATILDVSKFDTSSVTSMDSMFSGSKATTLDVSKFNTSNVTSMYSMFSNSSATEIIGLNNFNTSKVKTMEQMFAISKVSELDLSSFDTSNVTGMLSMFWFSSASVIDVSSFDTSKVTNMNQMFSYASNLVTIYASDKFVINSNCTTTNMFNNSSNLLGGKGTAYDSSKVDKAYARIDEGTSNPGYFTLKK